MAETTQTSPGGAAADGPAAPEASSAKWKPKRKVGWWVASAVALLALLAAGGWWLKGRKVWTYEKDNAAVRVPAGLADPREVLWTNPKWFNPDFNTADQEYEPAVSP